MLLTEFGAVRASSTERDSIQTINCNNFNIFWSLTWLVLSLLTANVPHLHMVIVVVLQQSQKYYVLFHITLYHSIFKKKSKSSLCHNKREK